MKALLAGRPLHSLGDLGRALPPRPVARLIVGAAYAVSEEQCPLKTSNHRSPLLQLV